MSESSRVEVVVVVVVKERCLVHSLTVDVAMRTDCMRRGRESKRLGDASE